MNGSRARPDLLVGAGLILAALVLTLPGFGAGKTLAGVDVENVFHYQNVLLGRFLREGAVPTWDPHVLCGFPLLAAAQSAFFYPFTWALAVLEPGSYWTFTVFVHLALSGLCMFAWLRSGFRTGVWAAGLGAAVYMLAGPQVLRVEAGHANYLMTLPWLPALFWRLDKYLEAPSFRGGLSTAVVVALLILPGVPQLAFAAALAAASRLALEGCTTKRWRDVAAVAGWAGIGLLLTAPQVLPTLELMGESQRGSLRSYAFTTSFSLPPENLLTLLAPTFFGDQVSVPYWGKEAVWEVGGYVGVGALLLAALAFRAPRRLPLFWAGVAFVAVLLSLGRHTPFFRVFHALVPGAGLFRGPGRYLVFFVLAVAPLAALGLQRLLEDPDGARKACLRVGTAGLLVAAALAAGWALLPAEAAWKGVVQAVDDGSDLNMAPTSSRADAELLAKTRTGAAASLAWAALGTSLLGGALLAFGKGRLAPVGGAAALSLLMAGELLGFSSRYFRGLETAHREWPADLVRQLQGPPGSPSRFASAGPETGREAGACRAAGLDHVGGYEPLLLRRYGELTNVAAGRPAEHPVVVAAPWQPSPILAMLNVRHLLFPRGVKAPDGLRALGGLGDRVIYEVPQGMPRAWMVANVRVLSEAGERLRVLADPAFDPRATGVLEEAVDLPAGPPGRVRLTARGPGEYIWEASSERGGLLLLSESWYPGWSAELDGRPVPLLRANHLLQAVVVPGGSHRIRFVYRSRFLGWGVLLFTLALLLPVAFRATLVRRRNVYKFVDVDASLKRQQTC